MGGGSTDKWIQAGAALGGFALGGPLGGAAALAATRKAQGKDIIGSDLKPKFPKPPGIPEPPQDDAAAELAKQRAIEERLRKAAFTGPGRKATIATSARGVTTRTPTRKRTLTGI